MTLFTVTFREEEGEEEEEEEEGEEGEEEEEEEDLEAGEEEGGEEGEEGGGEGGGGSLGLRLWLPLGAGLGLGLGDRVGPVVVTRLCLWLGLWLWLGLGLVHSVGDGRQGGGQVRGREERGGVELEAAEVDGELAAPDGEPLEVRDLHPSREYECGLVVAGRPQHRCSVVPVLEVLALEGMGKDGGLALVNRILHCAHGAHPKECIRPSTVIVEIFHHQSIVIERPELAARRVVEGLDVAELDLLGRGGGEEEQGGQDQHTGSGTGLDW